MPDTYVDWSTVSTQQGDLLVGLDATPDQAWVDAFNHARDVFESETREQTWEGVGLAGDYRS